VKIEYLLNPNKRKSSAHLFINGDTACRMLSTGGIKRERNQVFQSDMGRPICTMCSTTLRRKVAAIMDKEPVAPVQPQSGDFVVTEPWIRRYRTEAGAWRMAQLAAIGVQWPPTQGWISAVCGTRITQAAKAVFEKHGRQQDRQPRMYLDCPYEDRMLAKARGAKWDADARSWYITCDDITPFMQWIRSEHANHSAMA